MTESLKEKEKIAIERLRAFEPDNGWDEWSKLNGKKPRSESQIKKWLENPHSDSAEYKLYGNGIAVPCAQFVLSAIAFQERSKEAEKC